MSLEELLDGCGGFGKFQVLIIFGIQGPILGAAWSMLQMIYSGFIPEWFCVVGPNTVNNNLTQEVCSLNNSDTGFQDQDCRTYHYEGSTRTVVTEWDLVCDKEWVIDTMISIQMAGVFVGAVLGGQCATMVGRKKTLFAATLFHCALNIGAGFSTSWEMFAVFRFFIGFGVGAILVVADSFVVEFLPVKWRPLVFIYPVWPIGISAFAVASLVLDNWGHIHIACGVFGLPALLLLAFVPESGRWLTVKGRMKEAEKVFEKMAAMNGKTPPENMKAILQDVLKVEKETRKNERMYSYLDLFKGRHQLKISLIFSYILCMLSMTFYGITFGVSDLSENLYFNIFLLAIAELIPLLPAYYCNSRLGRKRTFIPLMVAAATVWFGCLIVHFVVEEDDQGNWLTGISLTAQMCIAIAWTAAALWSFELYPTCVRNLGNGLLGSASRIGGIIAPHVVDLDNNLVRTYIIISVLIVVAILLSLTVSETREAALPDSLIGTTTTPVEKNGSTLAAIDNGRNTTKGDAEKAAADNTTSFHKF